MLVSILKKLISNENLTGEEARQMMSEIMTGQAGEIRAAGLLTALSCKGETGEEIGSFARVMRHAAVAWPEIKLSDGYILCDTCGTGGDSSDTINISTLSAILLASMGVPVAKHGNRAVSSRFGSADLLESMGIRLDLDPAQIPICLDKVGICFLFAQSWHPAMKFAAPVRRALGVRTVFNLLGPLTNPAPITHQMIGLFNDKFMEPVSEALATLGREGAWVVHSEDGLDEVSISSSTNFIYVKDGEIVKKGELKPEDFGIKAMPLSELQIGNKDEAIERASRIMAGEGSEAENAAIAVNTALLLASVEGSEDDLKPVTERCLAELKSGKCSELVDRWQKFYHEEHSAVSAMGHLKSEENQ